MLDFADVVSFANTEKVLIIDKKIYRFPNQLKQTTMVAIKTTTKLTS